MALVGDKKLRKFQSRSSENMQNSFLLDLFNDVHKFNALPKWNKFRLNIQTIIHFRKCNLNINWTIKINKLLINN